MKNKKNEYIRNTESKDRKNIERPLKKIGNEDHLPEEFDIEKFLFCRKLLMQLEDALMLKVMMGVWDDLDSKNQRMVLEYLKFLWEKEYPGESFEESFHNVPGWEEISQLMEYNDPSKDK